MSRESFFADGKPIRGGIPLCWPWFGPHPGDSARPSHGIARLRAWTPMESAVLHDGRVRLRLAFRPEHAETDWVPSALQAELTLTVGRALEVELTTLNEGAEPLSYEEALHSYFAVTDSEATLVHGLGDVPYIDKLDGNRGKIQEGDVRFSSSEITRVFADKGASVEVADLQGDRRILIEKSGSANTVVWNPGSVRAAAFPDFGNDEWRKMCCVETANVGAGRIILLPGNRHTTRLRISLG
jgi:glucose-6-phosphate 1-epimerase